MALSDLGAAEVIARLGLEEHAEGGWFREVYRAGQLGLERAATALIYYMVAGGQRSRWHRLDCDEVWHYYAGAPLTLFTSPDGRTVQTRVLGLEVDTAQAPAVVVPAETWMSATSQGDWTLVGCQTAPAFEYAGFELAPEGWVPGRELT